MSKMGKNLKLGVGMMKYSLSPKLNFASIILFFILGIIYEMVEYTSSMSSARYKFSHIGAWMLAIPAMYAIQFLYGVCISGMIQSAATKKTIVIQATTVCKAVLEYIAFAILVVSRYIGYKNAGNEGFLIGLLTFGVYSMLLSIYSLVVYRYPVIGYAVILPLVIVSFMISTFISNVKPFMNSVSFVQRIPLMNVFGVYVIVGALIIMLDLLFFYILSKCMYKIPISEKSFKQMLERAK